MDREATSVAACRAVYDDLTPGTGADHVQQAEVESLPHADQSFDAVLSIAVLHFAVSSEAFDRMVSEMWRVLRPGGILFVRLATTITMGDSLQPLERQGWCRLPDGSSRFLVDEARLLALTSSLGGELLDPIKTTNVQGLRAMTTWVVARGRQDR